MDTQPPNAVRVWSEVMTIPTWLPALPDKNPMFLEKRVYQGGSGRVYPLPFTDRITEQKVDRQWQAVWIENEYLRALVLPELGGRIHALQDKTNGYDLIYRQPVIKPALVGLAGPWISGGIEFNWPQHHRPATFLPVDYRIESHPDGSATIWCSDHDPMTRMKGMHGVCLHPGRACLELKVRAYNRTPCTQTFLWWANVATRVHEGYQSFFPPDATCVADHARRSTSEYPLAQGFYYGVNYGERGRKGIPKNEIPSQFLPPHCRGKAGVKTGEAPSPIPNYAANDLSFYANIPTPCSYMCQGSREDFFGGYDFKAQAGIVHLANHHISPGKKQWTWGNHEFGYAWDRNLTEPDAQGEFGPYIEIMAGVYTDNQPDFSFLQPGETKSWSQFWYPIQKTGPVKQANLNAAVSLTLHGASVRLGVAVTVPCPAAQIVLTAKGKRRFAATQDLAPGQPFTTELPLPAGLSETGLALSVLAADGKEIIAYQPRLPAPAHLPPPATEPPPPEKIPSADELFITGLHLEQYRHATRCPTLYWREALKRDGGDSRCHQALGCWHFKRGEFALAESHLRRAIERLTHRNANPQDGGAYYHLGLVLRHLGRDDEAYDALYKACWNQAWQAAGYHALAELDCTRQAWATALDHLNRSLGCGVENLRARNLKVMVLHALRRPAEAAALLQATLALDPLDWWARHLHGEPLPCDLPTRLDVAHDFARAGFYGDAIALLQAAPPKAGDLPDQSWGALPLVHYTLGWLHQKKGNPKAARRCFQTAATLPPDYCFPARLEEIAILESAIAANPRDAKAPYYLGNLLYDRRRHDEALQLWETSARLDGTFSIVWRNLGIGYFNIAQAPAKARTAYERALRANPADARLLYERDQLWKRLRVKPAQRLRELQKYPHLVAQRDDLSVEMCALLNQTGQPAAARQLLAGRHFQPWEGGEGAALGQHVRTHLALGREALGQAVGEARPAKVAEAVAYFAAALPSPANLGEAKHLLANQSDIHYWLGVALDLQDQKRAAREHWRTAANFKGDFQEMRTRAFSEMTFFSALSLEKLGQKARAKKLWLALLDYAQALESAGAKMDYFATSLPTMLLFDDDLQYRQTTAAWLLQAQAQLGLGRPALAKGILTSVLQRDPSSAIANDFLHSFCQNAPRRGDASSPKVAATPPSPVSRPASKSRPKLEPDSK